MEMPPSRRPSRRHRRPVVHDPAVKFADVEEDKQDDQGSNSEMSYESSTSLVKGGEDPDSDFELPVSAASEVGGDIKQAVATITNNFTLTYAQVKQHPELLKAPLNTVGIPAI